MTDFIDWNFHPELIFGLFGLWILFSVAFEIFMLVDALRRPDSDFSSPGAKSGWIAGLIIGFFFIIPFGFAISIAYLFVVRIPAGRKTPAPAWTATPTPGAMPGAQPPPPPPGPAVPPAPMNCRTCGVKLVAGARFCHSCGTPVA